MKECNICSIRKCSKMVVFRKYRNLSAKLLAESCPNYTPQLPLTGTVLEKALWSNTRGLVDVLMNLGMTIEETDRSPYFRIVRSKS